MSDKNPTPLTHIIIKGARAHNLKSVNLSFPKNKFVVFTGLSGSGKSSLAFDTLYAEGQRRYVESLSSYARQFLGVMDKPDVDQIDGLSPAISIDQKTTSHNPRSTVGTITEIYDYLRLLFARIGHPHCPECGKEISTQSIDQIISNVFKLIEKKIDNTTTRIMIMAPIVQRRKGEFSALFDNLRKKGYQRLRIDGKIYDLSEELNLIKTNKHSIDVAVDRISTSKKQFNDKIEKARLKSRLTQSIEESLKLADGMAIVSFINDDSFSFPDKPTKFEDHLYSEKLACSNCNISLKELQPRSFSFNSPEGACPTCNGLGSILKIDKEKIIASTLTLSEGAIIPFSRMMSNDTWWARLVKIVISDLNYDFRKTPFEEMSEEAQKILLYGSKKIYSVTGENRFGKIASYDNTFEGFISNLERRYQETESDFIRREINQYMVKKICPSCHGARLKPESLAVHIQKLNINDITQMTIYKCLKWFNDLKEQSKQLSEKERFIAKSIIKEIISRLSFLNSVGLNYLSLSREASTLAGGEAQRIRLASQIGTGLTGVLYILDEPTIGLHQRDNDRLIETLKNLRDKGNSIVVVEHDSEVMLQSDHIVDFGPKAGKAGGEIVAVGTPKEIINNKNSITGKYLSKKKIIKRIKKSGERRLIGADQVAHGIQNNKQIKLYGATHHNLKSIDVSFPLGSLTCITGISGSGKSTLMHDTLYWQLMKHLERKIKVEAGHVNQISVPDEIRRLCLIDQTPIGKTPRSNAATYTKIFDLIRKIFANTKESKIRGYTAGRFSFNVKGGRCETCRGNGQIKIEMQFLPDVYVTCDVCHGKRYNQETLQILYHGKNIADILKMEITEAHKFFINHSTIQSKLQTLIDVGLGYLELGQSAPTLSGGEAQRVKLAKELSTKNRNHTVYLLDEPTTGLHFADVQKLLNVLTQLVNQGNTIVVIEHNMDVIKNADWIIDLGPEGGEFGGEIIAVGTPEQIAANTESFTGQYLKEEL